MANEKIEQNVLEFLGVAAKHTGRFAEDVFVYERRSDCVELGMQSPIEKLVWIAVKAVCVLNHIELDPDPITVRGKDVLLGMYFWPQFKLGKYRADFHASYYKLRRDDTIDKQDWIIECDGHDFHERNKQERQREKQRDRFFTVSGYKILRFTGSEIVKDPYAVASEIVKAVTNDRDIVTPNELWGK